MDLKTISDIMDTKLKAFSGGIVLDEYEKSLYLTDAQNAFYNALLEQFEDNSMISVKLSRILKELSLTTVAGTSFFGGYIIDLGMEVRDVLRDSVQITHASPMYNNKVLSVTEDRLAEIQETIINPFKKPDMFFEWAVRVINETDVFSQVQLYLPAGATVKEYRVTVAKKANPIILEDLPDGLSIQGETFATTELSFADAELQDIINLAVTTAIADARMFAAQPQQQPAT